MVLPEDNVTRADHCSSFLIRLVVSCGIEELIQLPMDAKSELPWIGALVQLGQVFPGLVMEDVASEKPLKRSPGRIVLAVHSTDA